MDKYLLTFEFRYKTIPVRENVCEHVTKTITIGVCDTIEESVAMGNIILEELAKKFDVRDKFKLKGLFGYPTTLVTNTCTNDKVEFFGKITTLEYRNLKNTVTDILECSKQYDIYINK